MTELNNTCWDMKEVNDMQIFNTDMLHQERSHDFFFLLHLSHSQIHLHTILNMKCSFQLAR
jgi:hypothetical protein